MQAPMPTLILIVGPTAVGKTAIAIQLAKALQTEIISADSRQCYQGMKIGTAQPSVAELAEVPHHFIDCFPPQKALTAADFEHLALQYLEDIFSRKNTAIVCGGTGLYIKALCEGLDEMPAVDAKINEKMNEEYARKGIEWLRDELQKLDPDFAVEGEMENPVRMLRALAFRLSVGESITRYRTGIVKERPFRIIKLGLELPRDLLYQRINLRVDQMMQTGLLEEVQQLLPLRSFKNLNTVGYTELFDYFDGKAPLSEAIDKIRQHSRNYAKRQLTWFKKDKAIHWFSANDSHLIVQMQTFLQQ